MQFVGIIIDDEKRFVVIKGQSHNITFKKFFFCNHLLIIVAGSKRDALVKLIDYFFPE